MTAVVAGTPCRCPQYGQRSEVVPGAYSSRAPHWEQGNVRLPGRAAGTGAPAASGAPGVGAAASGEGPAIAGLQAVTVGRAASVRLRRCGGGGGGPARSPAG